MVKCPYCGKDAVLVKANDLHGNNNYGSKKLWVCYDCSAWVGCHNGTDTPLGTLAKWKLRYRRRIAHAEFDFLWQSRGMTRSEGYLWLSVRLQLHPDNCHIGMMGLGMCQKVIDLCKEQNKLTRRLSAIKDFEGY